jgi:hypothetical protein
MTIARKSVVSAWGLRAFGQLTNTVIHDGELVAVDTAGFLRPARVSTTDVVVGIACINDGTGKSDATGITSGIPKVPVRDNDIAYMNNSTSGDLIANVNVGTPCYVVDSVTVGLTSGSSTRVVAGNIYWVNENGLVGVKFTK